MSENHNPMHDLWGSLQTMMPNAWGTFLPKLDPAEIDKQIRDLKTVENWMSMNLNMLQLTIKNLELQKSGMEAMQNLFQASTSSAPSSHHTAEHGPSTSEKSDPTSTEPAENVPKDDSPA